MTELAVNATRQKIPPAPAAKETLQRQCACGQHTHAGGECAECKKKRLQRKAATEAGPNTAPPIVQEVLRSPGRPLDASTRAFLEPRFNQYLGHVPLQAHPSPALSAQLTVNLPGDRYEQEAARVAESVVQGDEMAGAHPSGTSFQHDFSGVRIHTDARAAESACSVNALAYTVGNHLVFGAGQYSPQTTTGQRLLAHELVHVMQQGEGGRQVQRWADCKPPTLSLQECPPRTPGERSDARTGPMLFYSDFTDPVSGSNGALIVNFNIGSASIKSSLRDNQEWQDFLTAVEANGSQWRLLGFSDCEGEDASNLALRGERAAAVANAFPSQIRSQVVAQEAAPINDCITENSNASERSFNRSVAIIYDSSVISFPEEKVEATPPDYVCGPDVTSQVAAAVAATGAAFAGWSSDEKEDACDALDSLSTGACAWDIVELHNNAWIYQDYRPTCATQGADPPCGSTVQVDDECYYAGSANYVIFGTMCKLCADYYLSIPLINTGYARFTRSAMEDLIDLYKGSGFTGLGSPSGNFRESVDWANAGYDGWPSGGTPPVGDRSNCAPLCPTPYKGPGFTVEWAPHMDPYGCGR